MADLFAHLTETFIYKDVYKIRWNRMENSTKPAVILTHGTPFSSLEWLPYARALRADYCVYLWDLPGFDASQEFTTSLDEDVDVDVSYALHGEVFAALCRHWGFPNACDKRPHVVAHDIGGHAVSRAHVLHGVRYASLCLLDVVALTPWGTGFLRLVRENAAVFESVPQHIFQGMLEAYVRSASYKPLATEKIDEFVRPWLARGDAGRRSFVRQVRWASPRHTVEMAEFMGRAMESEESSSEKKLKIIWGEEDTWLPIEIGERLKDLTVPAEFVRVGGGTSGVGR